LKNRSGWRIFITVQNPPVNLNIDILERASNVPGLPDDSRAAGKSEIDLMSREAYNSGDLIGVASRKGGEDRLSS
jgi:hypothetical protein